MGGKAAPEREHITIVYPVYPNRTQEKELLLQFDVARGLYNHLLEEAVTDMIEGKLPRTILDMHGDITVLRSRDPDLRSVLVYSLREVADRMHSTMERFTKLSSETGKLHTPRFKKEGRYRSLAFNPETFRFDGGHLFLSKKLPYVERVISTTCHDAPDSRRSPLKTPH